MILKELAPFISCFINLDLQDEEGDALQMAIDRGYSQIYIQTKDGIFKHHTLREGRDGYKRFVRLKVTSVPGINFKTCQPSVQFLPDGKIPHILLEQVKQFFRQVIKTKGTSLEAMIWILWNSELGYHLHVPNQIVGPASASYDWTGVPPDSSIIVDIHSHANFSPFFSGTDNADDINGVRYSGVIGFNDKPVQQTVWRFNYYSEKIEVKEDDLFLPEVKPSVEIPENWLDKVSTRIPGHYSNGYQGKIGPDGTEMNYPRVYQSSAPYKGGRHNFQTALSLGYQNENENESQNVRELPHRRQKDSTEEATRNQSTTETRKEGITQQQSNEISSIIKSTKIGDVISINGMQFVRTKNGLKKAIIETPPSNVNKFVNITEPEDDPFFLTATEISSNFSGENFISGGNREENAEIRRLDRALENMERRQRLESLVSDREDELSELAEQHLNSLREEEEATEMNVFLTEQMINEIPVDEIPIDFDSVACNSGKIAANSYAVISHLMPNLVEAGPVMTTIVTETFAMADEETKGEMFYKIVELLPKSILQKIQSNGL